MIIVANSVRSRLSVIRIGIEVSSRNLHNDLLEHPERYFFILLADGLASLCIRTCDSQGENIQAHIIDGFSLNEDGNLYSVFEDGIKDAVLELQGWKNRSCQGDKYPLSSHLMHMISRMPDLMDWIISSIVCNGKNLVIYSEDSKDFS
jgi:hypothetical protein